MTFEEFLEAIDESVFGFSSNDSFGIADGYIYQRHETGGYRGGNCWGDSAEPYYNEEPMDEFRPLDVLLEQFYPEVSFLKYKKILNELEYYTEGYSEYYGNSTSYQCRKLDLRKIYDMITPND